MTDQYYTKHGFTGLALAGKLLFILIFVAVGAAVWFFFAKPDLFEGESLLSHLPLAIAKVVGIGLAAAFGVHFFLPKQQFQRQEFFCAECGLSLGYSIQRCPRTECGSNRYTTDAELAKRRAYQWQKQNRQ